MNQPERTTLFYMANLGSEFVRVFNALDKNNELAGRAAVQRCFGIIEKLKGLEEMKSRSEETDRLIDILNDFLLETPNYSISRSQIENYFNPFALRLTKV